MTSVSPGAGSRTSGDAPQRAHRATGPHPGALALVSLGLTVASLVAAAVLAGGAYVSPFAPTPELLQHYRGNGGGARLSALLLFGSAVPLGIFAAAAYTRLLRLGVRVPGPSIGFFGGASAASALMLCGMTEWVLTRPEVGQSGPVMHALALLAFISGGVGYVVGLGLLVAGVAVPTMVHGLVPRWFGWAGLGIALVAEASFLSMAIEPLQYLLPVGRFGGLLWLVAAGFMLPSPAGGKGDRA